MSIVSKVLFNKTYYVLLHQRAIFIIFGLCKQGSQSKQRSNNELPTRYELSVRVYNATVQPWSSGRPQSHTILRLFSNLPSELSTQNQSVSQPSHSSHIISYRIKNPLLHLTEMSTNGKGSGNHQSGTNSNTKKTQFCSRPDNGDGGSWDSYGGMAYKSEKEYVIDYSLGKKKSYERMRGGQKWLDRRAWV